MSRYGFPYYGTRPYGTLVRDVSRSYLLAQAIDYGIVLITVLAEPRIGQRYDIVRSRFGACDDPAQGVVVASGIVESSREEVIDGEPTITDDLTFNEVAVPAGPVYYTLFVYDDAGAWFKDAATSVVVPQDRGSLTFLLRNLPRVLVTKTGDPLDEPEVNSDLANFLGGLAVTYDEFQTSLDLVLPNESRAPGSIRGLHESYARSVGMPVEFTIGVGASSRLFRNSGKIYRSKGTLTGLQSFAESLTGWSVETHDSPNLLRTLDDASFESSTGSWGITGGTLVRQPIGSVYADDSPETPHDYIFSPYSNLGVGLVALTSTSAALQLPPLLAEEDDTDFSTGRTLTNRARAIPIKPSTQYQLSGYFKAHDASSASATWSISWVDEFGEEISTGTGTATSIDDDDSWHKISSTLTSPASAAFARVGLAISGSSGNLVLIDRIQLSTPGVEYHDPQQATVVCAPSRINLLEDPSFENESGWTATTGTAAANTAEAFLGTRSLLLSGTSGFVAQSESVPAVAQQVYTFSAYCLGDAMELRLVFFDSDGDEIVQDVVDIEQISDTYLGSASTEETELWERFSVSGLSPEGTATMKVQVSGDGTSRIDAVLLELSDRPRTYFDGETANLDGTDVLSAVVGGKIYPLLYPALQARLARLRLTLPYYLPLGVSARILLWNSTDPVVAEHFPYGPHL